MRLTQSYMVLIPKCASPQMPSDFRPIGLGNDIYKIFARLIANRLKIILSKNIHESQSGFLFVEANNEKALCLISLQAELKKAKAEKGIFYSLMYFILTHKKYLKPIISQLFSNKDLMKRTILKILSLSTNQNSPER